jgi:type II secretory pathway pseudopilin PulG
MGKLKAFTLLELLFVIGLSAILVAVGFYFLNFSNKFIIELEESQHQVMVRLNSIKRIEQTWLNADLVFLQSESNKVVFYEQDEIVASLFSKDSLVIFEKSMVQDTLQALFITHQTAYQPDRLLDKLTLKLTHTKPALGYTMSKIYAAENLIRYEDRITGKK